MNYTGNNNNNYNNNSNYNTVIKTTGFFKSNLIHSMQIQDALNYSNNNNNKLAQ